MEAQTAVKGALMDPDAIKKAAGHSVLAGVEAGPNSSSRPPPETLLPSGYLLAARYRIRHHLSEGGFGTVFRAIDTLHPSGPEAEVAIKLEVYHTLPDNAAPIGAKQSGQIKAALLAAKLQREWAVYSRLGAVSAPGQNPKARQHGVPLVHAWGEL